MAIDLEKYKLPEGQKPATKIDLEKYRLPNKFERVEKQGIVQQIESWWNKPAFTADDISKSGAVKGLGKTGVNVLKSIGRTATDIVAAPVKGLAGIPQIPKEVQALTKESGGILPAIKNYVSSLPKTAYENLIPEAGQKLIEGKPMEAVGSLAENPAQVAPFLLGGIKGVSRKAGVLQKPLETYGKAIDKTLAVPKSVVGQSAKAVGKAITSQPVKDFTFGVKTPVQKMATLDKTIELGVSKGIKPTVVGKKSLAGMSKFYDNAKVAVKTIAENKSKIKVLDENGEVVAHPQSSAQAAQAIDQAKKIIYKEYSDMSLKAGDMGAMFNDKPIVSKLTEVSKNKGNSPKVRSYAKSMIKEVEELRYQTPEVIEKRIAEYNQSLTSFYSGTRIDKSKAQVDASVAKSMREQLDSIIENTAGDGYKELKSQYGALKSIEKEVNKRALVNARQAGKSVADLTDIFTGGDILTGILSANPALIARGAAGINIKNWYKQINNPDRYISNMFKKAYETIPESTTTNIPTNTPFRRLK
jgi:hypothetical protein